MVQRYTCLNSDSLEGDWISAEYLRKSAVRSFFLYLTYIATFGISYLLKEWIISVHLIRYKRCPPKEATHILITGRDNCKTLTELHHKKIDKSDIDQSLQKSITIEVTYS